MEMKEFAIKVQKTVQEILGAKYEVKLQEVQKNNGVFLTGLVILRERRNVSPTIYLQAFWEAYEEGVTFAEVIYRILQIYNEDTPKRNVDMAFFREFEKVKDRICYRLIHAKKNESLLEKIPHIPFLDLAICFYYAYEGKALGNGSILIYNTHMEMWKTNLSELLYYAQNNTPRLFPWECNSMELVIRNLMEERGDSKSLRILEEEEEKQLFDDLPMYIVSNRQKLHGAACMIYPAVFAKLAENFQSNFYIIPSSIHEVILLTDNGTESPSRLQEMIREVNKTQVEPEEVLSDSLYYFDRKENRIKIV